MNPHDHDFYLGYESDNETRLSAKLIKLMEENRELRCMVRSLKIQKRVLIKVIVSLTNPHSS